MHGDRVRLRARTPDDADHLHTLWSDVDTQLSASDQPYVPRSAAAIRARIERDLGEAVDRTGDVWLTAESVGDGAFIGTAGLWGLSSYEHLAHLAVTLLPAARGQGYGRDLVGLLCGYGFRLRNLRRLELETLATNTPMRRAAEANGFVLEGTQRERAYDGAGYGDLAIYGLLRSEWQPDRQVLP
jgi:RimJ/RimL family protein N-acetyltransferase